MKFISKILITVIFLFSSSANAQTVGFDYLNVKRNKIKTTHQAKYLIKINKSFKFLGEFHHKTNSKKPFNVSMVAYSYNENLILIHAENHTDGTGGIDYSHLPMAKLNKVKFNSREQCASPKKQKTLEINPQIKFIREKGFDLTLPFYFKQFIFTTKDGSAEIVISYGRKIKSCDEITEYFREKIIQMLRRNIKIKKSK